LQSFIGHIQQRCPVFELRSENDWRTRDRRTESSLLDANLDNQIPQWATTLTGNSTWLVEPEEFDKILDTVVSGRSGGRKDLKVYGRSLDVPWQIEGVAARFTFAELCERALGPADYLSLTSQYPTIIIDKIPQLKLSAKNEARRFITFLDAAYESKCRLICHAASLPGEIFFPDAAKALANEDNPLTADMLGEVMQDLEAPFRPNISSYRGGALKSRVEAAMEEAQTAAPAFRNLSIFTGQDEQFAYKRALSRIHEITSREYIKTAVHAPVPAEARVWEHEKPQTASRRILSGFNIPEDSEEDTLLPKGIKVDPLDENIDPASLPKPKIADTHFWGVVDNWGAKAGLAGLWGQGVRAKQKEVLEAERKQRLEMMGKGT
jgi:protein AFG1